MQATAVLRFSVMPLSSTGGWLAHAFDAGLKVTSAPRRFGTTEFFVRNKRPGGELVVVTQALDTVSRGKVENASDAQRAMLSTLDNIGMLKIDRAWGQTSA
jgi:hypothetical protein